jgi:AraC-like DNA-binding protein
MEGCTHAHPSREIVIGLEGDHRYGVGGRIHPLRPGTVLLLEAGEAHDAGYPPFARPCRDLWLVLAPPHCVFVNEVRAGGGRPIALSPRRPLAPAFAECLAASWDACRAAPGDPVAVRQLQAAAALAILAALRSPAEAGTSATRQRQAVERIRRYIAGNLGHDLGLKRLAYLAGYAPEHFHRIFRQRTGCTLHEHVARLRLERARQLLAAGEPVAGVAAALGFGSAAYFSRFFRRVSGRAPTAARG